MRLRRVFCRDRFFQVKILKIMNIPLQAFEQYIDPVILSRGEAYFKQGRVGEPTLVKSNQLAFVVEGSDEYRVTIVFNQSEILRHDCTCPYEAPVCKHVVACIFYMQKDELGLPDPKKKVRKKKKVKPSVEEQAQMILEKLAHEDLMRFTEEFVLANESFRDYFLTTFAYLNPYQTITDYKKMVRAEVRARRRGRYRFIDMRNASALGNQISKILTLGEQHLQNGRFESAFFIGAAVLEEMYKAFDYADDSGGDIGRGVDEATALLKKVAAEVDEGRPVRKQLYKYGLKHYEKQTFEGWDWHGEMIEIAQRCAVTAKEIEEINSVIETEIFINRDVDYKAYYVKRLELTKYNLILRLEGKEKAITYAKQKPHNVELREKWIHGVLDDKDYQQAIDIAKDGVDIAGDNVHYARRWQYWLLVLYIEIQSEKEVVEIARQLFLSDQSQQYKYLKILKDFVAPKYWRDFVKELIEDVYKGDNTIDLLTRIYIFEERWQELLSLLQEEPSLYRIKDFEPYLAGVYSDELIELYYQEIKDYLFNAYGTGRKFYKTACSYMKRMNNLGGRQKVEQLKEELIAQFPRRPALIEELAKV